jgi:hypothetical protein
MRKYNWAMIRGLYIFERRMYETARLQTRNTSKLFSNYLPSNFWDGRSKRKSIWPKIAQSLRDQGVDAMGYIPQVFESYQFMTQPPEPNHLLSKKCIDEYIGTCKIAMTDVRVSIRGTVDYILLEQTLYQAELQDSGSVLDDRQLLQHLLLGPSVNWVLSFCLANCFGLDEIVLKSKHAAAREYSRRRKAYERLLSRDYIRICEHLPQYYAEFLEGWGRLRRWN